MIGANEDDETSFYSTAHPCFGTLFFLTLREQYYFLLSFCVHGFCVKSKDACLSVLHVQEYLIILQTCAAITDTISSMAIESN